MKYQVLMRLLLVGLKFLVKKDNHGYLWYLKASGDTMSRFADYCEMVCIEGELAFWYWCSSGGALGTDSWY